MVLKVKVINGTREEIVIKEGSAGIYREVRKIAAGGDDFVSVDEHATYREFVCLESRSGLKVILTSDDCIDYSEVRIMYDEHRVESKLYMDPTRRQNSGIAVAAMDANIGKAFKGIGKTLKGALSWSTSLFEKKAATPPAITGNPAGTSGATP